MGTPPQGAPSFWVQLVPFALVLGIFYFIIVLPMRRKQQKVEQFHSSLKVGDKVITSGGIFCTITRLNEQSVQVEIAERSASTWRAPRLPAIRGRTRWRPKASHDQEPAVPHPHHPLR